MREINEEQGLARLCRVVRAVSRGGGRRQVRTSRRIVVKAEQVLASFWRAAWSSDACHPEHPGLRPDGVVGGTLLAAVPRGGGADLRNAARQGHRASRRGREGGGLPGAVGRPRLRQAQRPRGIAAYAPGRHLHGLLGTRLFRGAGIAMLHRSCGWTPRPS